MIALLKRVAAVVLISGLLPAAAGWLHAQKTMEGSVARGFTLPDYDDKNRLKSLISGKEARPQPGGQILLKQVRVETYKDNGKVDLVVEASECVFDIRQRVASSPGSMQARTADGRFAISGEGFLWRQADSYLIISNQVHTYIMKELLEPVSEKKP